MYFKKSLRPSSPWCKWIHRVTEKQVIGVNRLDPKLETKPSRIFPSVWSTHDICSLICDETWLFRMRSASFYQQWVNVNSYKHNKSSLKRAFCMPRVPFALEFESEQPNDNSTTKTVHWTRMHSSRMRTAHLLTVSQHALPGGVPVEGVYLPRGGVPARGCTHPGGVPARGLYLPRGCTCPGTPPRWT